MGVIVRNTNDTPRSFKTRILNRTGAMFVGENNRFDVYSTRNVTVNGVWNQNTSKTISQFFNTRNALTRSFIENRIRLYIHKYLNCVQKKIHCFI